MNEVIKNFQQSFNNALLNSHLKNPYFATFREFSTLSTDHNNTTTNYSYYYVYVMQKIEKMKNENKNANESSDL